MSWRLHACFLRVKSQNTPNWAWGTWGTPEQRGTSCLLSIPFVCLCHTVSPNKVNATPLYCCFSLLLSNLLYAAYVLASLLHFLMAVHIVFSSVSWDQFLFVSVSDNMSIWCRCTKFLNFSIFCVSFDLSEVQNPIPVVLCSRILIIPSLLCVIWLPNISARWFWSRLRSVVSSRDCSSHHWGHFG